MNEIQIKGNWERKKTDAEVCSELLKAPPSNLVKIDMERCHLRAQGLLLISQLIASNHASLTEVKLHDCEWNEMQEDLADDFIKAVEGCYGIRKIWITDGTNDAGGDNVWSRVNFASLHHLENFSYGGNTAQDMLHSFTSLLKRTPCSLATLNLTWSGTPSAQVTGEFFQALKKNTSVKDIDLSPKERIRETLWSECFEENRAVTVTYPYPYYGVLNSVCNELRASETMRRSVPKELRSEYEIREFLKQLIEGGETWNKLKIVFLGHGEVGKTTLLGTIAQLGTPALSNRVFKNERTIGVDISTLKVGKGQASVWDFGGQLEYAVTHQFLLSNEMVVYILCYDISASDDAQIEQVSYWLDFLHSTLSAPKGSHNRWQVMVVGTKSDLRAVSLPHEFSALIPSWTKGWPDLPFHDKHFVVSSYTMEGIDELWQALEQTCGSIFDNNPILAPKAFTILLDSFKALPPDQHITTTAQLERSFSWGDSNQFHLALKYFHAIGEVILLQGGVVCVEPQVIPKITAEFISPEIVRRRILDKYKANMELLDKGQIGQVLQVHAGNKELDDKLALMERIGVCFKMACPGDPEPCYLFPSLASFSGHIKFTLASSPNFQHAGLRITAPPKKVFTYEFFYLLTVQLLLALEISKEELVAIHKNGFVVQCDGAFLGQMIVKLERHMQSIVVLIFALEPNFDFATHTIHQLIESKFAQAYNGFTEALLCPSCLPEFLTTTELLRPLKAGTERCFDHRAMLQSRPTVRHTADIHKCKTHGQEKHHIFLSYRVAAEGKQVSGSLVEKKEGFVEVIYRTLAVQKLKFGRSVFVFWDQKCLNFGQDWEDGFLHGITHSTVIVLLVSNKVIKGICANATKKQDNVLVEHGTPVIPVFAAGMQHSILPFRPASLSPFNFEAALKKLPDAKHKREKRARRIIEELSASLLPHEVEFLNSVKETLSDFLSQRSTFDGVYIFHMQGVFMGKRGEDRSDLDKLVQQVMDEVHKHL